MERMLSDTSVSYSAPPLGSLAIVFVPLNFNASPTQKASPPVLPAVHERSVLSGTNKRKQATPGSKTSLIPKTSRWVDLAIHPHHEPPPQIEVTDCFDSHISSRAGSEIHASTSRGCWGACRLVGHHRPHCRLRILQYPGKEGGRLANGIRRSQEVHRNCQGILQCVPSTEGCRRRHVHLDKGL